MSLVLKFQAEESNNAESFNIKDTSTGWGTDGDPASGAIAAAILIVDSGLYDAVFYDMIVGTRLTEFLSVDGHEVPIVSIFPTLSGFPDDYYSMRLIINTDGSDLVVDGVVQEDNVDFSYDYGYAFLAYCREAERKLPLPLDWDNFDSLENRKINRIFMLTEGAEADANQGNVNRFKAKMQFVSEQLNLRGIEYTYTFE